MTDSMYRIVEKPHGWILEIACDYKNSSYCGWYGAERYATKELADKALAKRVTEQEWVRDNLPL